MKSGIVKFGEFGVHYIVKIGGIGDYGINRVIWGRYMPRIPLQDHCIGIRIGEYIPKSGDYGTSGKKFPQ